MRIFFCVAVLVLLLPLFLSDPGEVPGWFPSSRHEDKSLSKPQLESIERLSVAWTCSQHGKGCSRETTKEYSVLGKRIKRLCNRQLSQRLDEGGRWVFGVSCYIPCIYGQSIYPAQLPEQMSAFQCFCKDVFKLCISFCCSFVSSGCIFKLYLVITLCLSSGWVLPQSLSARVKKTPCFASKLCTEVLFTTLGWKMSR